jgi:hypothetical protein
MQVDLLVTDALALLSAVWLQLVLTAKSYSNGYYNLR